jgi:hypothetical protein
VVAASWLGLLPGTGCEDRGSRPTMGTPAALPPDDQCLMGEPAIQQPGPEIGPMPREVKE